MRRPIAAFWVAGLVVAAALGGLSPGSIGTGGAAQAQRLDERVMPKVILRLAEPGELAEIREAVAAGDAARAGDLILSLTEDDSSPQMRYTAQNALCVLHTRLAAFDAAEAACQAAIAIRPEVWMAHNSLATAYLQKGEYDAAAAAYARAADLAPSGAPAEIVAHNQALLAERRAATADRGDG
ncbi:hypothetical protein CKO24_10395 [Rhodothalassium salexigens DSM 2132]|nr:hypothetical protein [Rhodothalassium salexigens DSM 2132]